MSASSAPAAKAGLLTLLAARAALNGVQQSWAHPGKNIESETIFLGRVRSTETAAALGRQRRDEDYNIDVIVTVHQAGDDAQTVEERAWTLAGEVEQAVRADPTLNGAVNVRAVINSFDQDLYIESDGRVAEILMTVNVHHRK